MSNNLVIVESPTKSKTIEKFLGKNYTVVASMGHLRDLPKSKLGVDVANNFTPEYINIRGKGDLIKALKKDAQKADKVYLATDPDREGEAISWHLAYLLGIDPSATCRIEFHEITKTAVADAIKHPRAIDMDMVDAQQARRIIDRIVGYKISPMLWPLKKGLSAGRVQSVAVKIVADRDKEIAAFVPEEFWTLNAKLRENAKEPIFEAETIKYKGKKLTIANAEQAHAAEEALQKAKYVVEEAQKKDKKRHPAPPFTTSTMQQEANRRLNFTSKKTMMLAQQLYEGVNIGRTTTGLITYMRTDSVRMADVAVHEIRDYVGATYGNEYVPAKPNFFASKKNAQDAHEAIRPTSIARRPEDVARYLNRDQLRLYSMIWNRAVASQMEDAVYDATTLMISAGDYTLRATGSVLKFAGFLELSGALADPEKDKPVPFIPEGTEVQLHKLLPAEQHFTEPPAHFTEATLVKELEDKGIGRPSTFATTIATIQDRGYVMRDGKKLMITELGNKVNDWLTANFTNLIDIPYTADMETELDKIAEENLDKNVVIAKLYDYIASVKPHELPPPPPPAPTGIFCEKCGKEMVEKVSRYGKFLACPGFPACRNIKSIVKTMGVACPKCGGDVIEKKTKSGKVFYGCSNYKSDGTGCDFNSWDRPLNETCAKCGSMMVDHINLNRRHHKYCSNEACENARHVGVMVEPEKTTKTRAKKTVAKKTTTRKTTKAKKE
ncbi:MAG: type I DNA topoisomerase [Phascolarctobacterium sp.]|nr:type I DNA topoisomerase [Phascolarctobacterium sp.]